MAERLDGAARWMAAAPDQRNPEDDADALVVQGARELGFDRVSLKDLQALSRSSLPSKEDLEINVQQPNKKRLTWGDIPGALDLLAPFEPRAPPSDPVYDSGEWINTHYPRYGYAARGALYSWRDWATAALPPGDVAAYLAVEALMADDERRGGLIRQAQWELARLWDWQRRRAALGLTADLPRATTPTAASAAPGSSAQPLAEAPPPEAETSSGPEPQDGELGVLGVLENSGLYGKTGANNAGGAAEFDAARASSSSSSSSSGRTLPPGDGIGNMSYDEWAQLVLKSKPLHERASLVDAVINKVEEGRTTAMRGRRRTLWPEIKRVHRPQRDGEDTFLPAAPYDDEAAAVPGLPPLDPSAVAAAARAQEAVARSPAPPAGEDGPLPPAGRRRARMRGRHGDSSGAGVSGPLGSVSRWSDLDLLDRAALEARLVAELAAQDGWSFDLAVRPPTAALDLLTDYLEVKYRDLLLKRDAVTTLQRRVFAQRLAASGGEAAEMPPLALVVPQRLSPAERDRIVTALDAALAAGDSAAYRRLAEGLYRDGAISVQDLGACLTAAAAAEREGAAAATPTARDELWASLSGGHRSGAPAVWDAAAQRAVGGSTTSSTSSSPAVSYEEAQAMWDGLLSGAGLGAGGPQLGEVLGAGEVGSAGLASRLQALQDQLRQISGRGKSGGSTPPSQLWDRLQQAVARTTSDTPSAAGSGACPDLDVALQQERHRLELAASSLDAPPYPGASRLLRWQQQIIFHAAAATDPHPEERKAVLRVHAGELAQEAGLSSDALAHVLRVAGLKSKGGRYDPTTGDIKLVCDRFPTREENRRWCLDALHRLLEEGNRAHPSTSFLFSPEAQRPGGGVASPFVGAV